jgi:hypothetical protein
MITVLSILGVLWLASAVVCVATAVRLWRARNRRGGRLGRLLSASHPEWN